MIRSLVDALSSQHEDYDALPDPVKSAYTPHEWLWLSDAQKAQLVQSETEPEWNE